MRRAHRWLTLGLILTLLLGVTGKSIPTAEAAIWQEKVDPWVFAQAPQGEIEFLVFLNEQADLSSAADLIDKTAKGAYVFEVLTSFAETSQKPIRATLDSDGTRYQPFWIANMLWVRGDINTIQQIAQRHDVRHIYANPQVQLSQPERKASIRTLTVDAVEWNILKINADDVWAEGYTGQGVVIGGQDTGYAWDHPALINQYRGWNGINASHDYNWYDATGLSPEFPVDPHSHGTHTMGTMVGDDGGINQTGVAPGAKWIGCRNMNSAGYGTPATYIACYQWFVAPTRTDGSDPRPDLAPDVINNSWSCPAYEGCTDPDMLLAVVQAVRAAGILTVHSAGNDGALPYPDNCGTVDEPATIYAESFSVGSTTSSDTISSFSSRGPVMVDGSNRLKPQVSAPGSTIRSTIPGGGYGFKSGTSMAAPHVTGLAALLISAQPALSGQVDILENLIEQSALPLYTNDGCGGDTPSSHPNHTYGWGRIDAWNAYQVIPHGLLVNKTAPKSILPGEILTYTLTVTNSHPFSATHNIILTDTLPEKTSFVSATGNYSTNSRLVIWSLDDLPPKGIQQVELAVHIPQSTKGIIKNESYEVGSDEVNPATRGLPIDTTIHEPGVDLSPGHSGTIFDPCNLITTLKYNHQITNTGTYTDTFYLISNSSQGWAHLDIGQITLGAGETEILTIENKPPCPTQPATVDIITTTAISAADESITATISDHTKIGYRYFFPLSIFIP